MRFTRFWGAIGLLLTAALAVEAQQPQRRDGDLKEGNPAPEFTIKDVEGKKTVKLSRFRYSCNPFGMGVTNARPILRMSCANNTIPGGDHAFQLLYHHRHRHPSLR